MGQPSAEVDELGGGIKGLLLTSGFGCGRCTLKGTGEVGGDQRPDLKKLNITAPVPISQLNS